MNDLMRHRVGTVLLVVGLGLLAWAAAVYLWKDPFTTAYTAYEQRRLEKSLDERFRTWTAPQRNPAAHVRAKVDLAPQARRFRLASHDGDAIAKIDVPRLGLDAVVVNGTAVDDLRRGPGRHLETYMPGEGRLVYIAGHRTTYGAPFSKIDTMRPGDRIRLRLPYGTVTYAVTGHRIVDDNDLSVLRSPNHEVLVLQACHPRFFASQRYLVYARPIAVSARAHS
jgi:sortase A